MKRYFNITLFFALLAIRTAANAATPVPYSFDSTLAILRGSWEFHTFEDKWTLVFESDHNLVIDRNDARYTLLPDSIRVINDQDTIEYPITLKGGALTLQLPDGSERTYRKTGDGEAEKSVKGILYATIDSTMRQARVSFDGNHTFVILDEIGEDIGIYRVEGSTIYLTLNDTVTYSAQIRSWNNDGSIDELAFDGRLFQSEKPSTPYNEDLPTVAYSPPPEPPMPPIFLPDFPPAYPIPTPPRDPVRPIIPSPPSPTPPVVTPTPARTPDNPESKPVRTSGLRRAPNK